MNKIIKLLAMCIGFGAIIDFTYLLIFNKVLIAESNQFIRFTEIGTGLFAIIVFCLIFIEEIKK